MWHMIKHNELGKQVGTTEIKVFADKLGQTEEFHEF